MPKHRNEIAAIAEKRGFKVRDITLSDVRRMSPDELLWYEYEHGDRLAKVLNSKMSHAAAKASNARNLLMNPVATDADLAKATAALNLFLERFPQFVLSEGNHAAIVLYMLEKNLDCRDYKDIVTAYEKCAVAGTITVQVGDKQLTGDWLKAAIRHDETLLDPLSPRQTAEAQARRDVQETIRNTSGDILKMAINEMYREENAAHQSAFEQNAVDQAVQSLLALRPAYMLTEENNEKMAAYMSEHKLSPTVNGFTAAYDALSSFGSLELQEGNIHEWGGSKIIDYGEKPSRGGTAVAIVEKIDKASLRRKVAGMTSSQTAEFFRANRSAQEAFDSV
jgi:hypothetical protein